MQGVVRRMLAVAAGCGAAALLASGAVAATPQSAFLPKPPFAGPAQLVRFGNVVSLARAHGRWEARVDPAEFLTGETANHAAAADGVVAPGEPVPNDNYVRFEGHRLLTYLVKPTADVTVVTNDSKTGIRATPITVAELAQVVSGHNPRLRPLFEPRNGFWLRVASDTILALDQQYTP
jgi:hypothetical protein